VNYHRRIALKIYFLIQRKAYSQMSKQEYSELIEKGNVLESDHRGVKVVEVSNGIIYKIFRLKRLFSSAYFFPYASKFKKNASELKKRGIETVEVDSIFYCEEEQRHILSYKKVLGMPIRSILEIEKDNKTLLKKFIRYVSLLHSKGIYFRSLHFGNVIVKPNGDFVLIDISDMLFFNKKLTINHRVRNWHHVIKNKFEREIIDYYGWDGFINEYASCSELGERDTRKLKLRKT